MIYLGPPDDVEDRLAIFSAITRDFCLDQSCSIRAVARMCPKGVTGADIYSICADAMMSALQRKIKWLDRKRMDNPDFKMDSAEDVIVEESDFVHALEDVRFSVSLEV
jgi:SpoVK/Ycf46/Vps4 family AAA+-type ATPase